MIMFSPSLQDIYSFARYLKEAYYVPDTALDAVETTEKNSSECVEEARSVGSCSAIC